MADFTSRVAAVVVSYNVRDLLVQCIGSLIVAKERCELNEIVVVDNGSSDGSADAIRDRFRQVRVIDAENRGYGAGANVGIAATCSQYVLVLNPDTVVPPGTVASLTRYLDEHPDVAVVGPRLRYPDGTVQRSMRRFPQRLTPLFESTILQEWWPANPWTRAYYMDDVSDDVPQPVDWLVGAALLVRRDAIESVGGFDEAFRMYAEEVEWCWRFRQHGWKVVYYPLVEIIHHEGASTRQNVATRQIEFDRSRIRLMHRLYGGRQAMLIRIILLGNYAVHLLRETMKWLLGHRRDLRRQRIGLYLGAIRSGIRDVVRAT